MHYKMLDDKAKRQAALRELYIFITLTIIGGVMACVFLIGCAQAAIPEETAVRCILGEARGESKLAMTAHAEALRNRGTTSGVYGCDVVISQQEMRYIRSRGIDTSARMAWRESANTNLVDGATFWGGIAVDGNWIEKMRRMGFTQTAKVGNTVFFKGK